MAELDISTKKRKVIRKKIQPARVQMEPSALAESSVPPQTGTSFNLWYGKWSGGQGERHLVQTKAIARCSISKDSGFTRGSRLHGAFFCLFFARGICPKGQDCEYLHRLPEEGDQLIPNMDCFGRDKHSDYRDDMGGVGSFLRQNRTLYVGRVSVGDAMEEVVSKHFNEWGRVERIRVLNARGVAFVTYASESNAQFAKEAMAHQSLDDDEILNVRWATVDPNPVAQAREKRKIDLIAESAIRRALEPDHSEQSRVDQPSARDKRARYAVPATAEYGMPSTRARLLPAELAGEVCSPTSSQSAEQQSSKTDQLLKASTIAALRTARNGPPGEEISHTSSGQSLIDYRSDASQ